MDPKDLKLYRWPTMEMISRQYVVRDDRSRYGIAHSTARNEGDLWAHPIEYQAQEGRNVVPGTETLPINAVLMTGTLWKWNEEVGAWTGFWCDDQVPTFPATVPPEMIRRLTIVDDLGWIMPDWVADQALAGSDQGGHWNYGAKLGKIGGEPPVKGQHIDEMTVQQAEDYSREVGETVTRRNIRKAAHNGYIPGARKIGRDWLIPYEGFNHYLDHRPKRGPKPK